jgi:hypothetical protein
MTILLERAWEIIRDNRSPYLVLNILYYGLILLLMTYAAFNLPLQEQVLQESGRTYLTGALALYGKTATDTQVFTGLGYTFFSNILGASYGGITLPSFVIPFVGVFLGLYRAAIVGLVFSPFSAVMRPFILPHLPTLLMRVRPVSLPCLGPIFRAGPCSGRKRLDKPAVGAPSLRAFANQVRFTCSSCRFY